MGDSKELRRSSSSASASASASANAEGRMKFASVDALSELVWSPRSGLSLRCADFNFTGVGGSVGDTKPEREEMDKVETNDDSETRLGTSKRSLDSPRGIRREPEDLLVNEQLRLERAGSQEVTTKLGDKTALDAEHLEATDENDLASPASKALVACESKGECLPQEETDAEKAGPIGLLTKAKGKEKALSDGNFDDDECFGSVESCNSAGLLSRGKKRAKFEQQQQLILGSKRLKTLSQECLESTWKLKQDSSFMNWISNMTKGIWKGSEEDNSPLLALTTTSDANGQLNSIVDHQEMSPCCLKENSGCRNTGFQSFFQSIYCQKKSDQDAVKMVSSYDASSGNEVVLLAEPNISSGKVGFYQTSEAFSSEKKNEDKEPNISLFPLSSSKPSKAQKTCCEADEKVVECLTNKNSALESLWISRFSSKSSFPQKKDLHERLTNVVAKKGNDLSSDAVKTRDSQNAILPIVTSLRIESSEAMASLFARRLEAMKHMLPTGSLAENTDERDRNLICFYCGKKGHRLQECLEVTDTELRDLVRTISVRNGKEEVSTLCIRCFQLSHWAATCPNAPPYEDRSVKHSLAFTSGPKLPFSGFTDVPKAVFEAVKVLRLTRTDVLKWINSKKSVSGLEGFFLRLRLGKWAEGLGGTGYHVACIEGATKGQSSKKHPVNSSVSVKVGGITSFVESQFISNHDFLEEELLAWWRSAGKCIGGSGGCIPSTEELSQKIQQRKMLGF
ncbi:hypothetical protein N665_0051s0033 [Sinapis alba]|nr:hypothetical protein N665_0051s0033 [Sinapis alba]